MVRGQLDADQPHTRDVARTSTGIEWSRKWDAMGTHETIFDWYQTRALAQGWRPWDRPSITQRAFYKGKFLLTVSGSTRWSEPKPHAEYDVQLRWGYWHRLELNAEEVLGQEQNAR